MDVRCERCGTEYEFDDALVSGRGTTVKCTNCGHKFKIRRSDGDYSEDFWNVQTGDGRTLVFTSLRELQRAIQARLVDRTDTLSRGGLPPKPIGGIPELAPFFEQRDQTPRDGRRGGTLPPAPPKLDGGPGPADATRLLRPPPPPGAVAPALGPPRQRVGTRPDFPAPPAVLNPSVTKTIPGTGDDETGVVTYPPVRPRMGSVPPLGGHAEGEASPLASTTPSGGGGRAELAAVGAIGTAATQPAQAAPVADLSRTQPMTGGSAHAAALGGAAEAAGARSAAFRAKGTLPGVAPPTDPNPRHEPRPSVPPPLPAAARSGHPGRIPSRAPPVRVGRAEPRPVDDYADDPDTAVVRSDPRPSADGRTSEGAQRSVAARESERTPRAERRKGPGSDRSLRAGERTPRAAAAASRGGRGRVHDNDAYDEADEHDEHERAEPRRRSRGRERAVDVSSPLPLPRIASSHVDYEEYGDARRSASDLLAATERRRPVGGYLIALVIVLGVGVVGAYYARDRLARLATKPEAAVVVDPRVATFLASGEQALAEGNLDLAKESYDKASALSERDARVLLGVARLAAARADVLWLKSRLLPSDAADEHRLARDGLAELAQSARVAADAALAVAAADPAALRAKIDALRISGDRDGARALVVKLNASAPAPETAYVLAALDLADSEQLWPSIIERLRVAAAAESGPGRARALLVYALARSGDAAGAKAEVERLAGMARQHALLPQLRAFADRAKSAPPPVASSGTTKPDAGALAAVAASPPGPGAPQAAGAGPPSGDPRVLVAQAEAARAKGSYEKARLLYSAALDRNPNDSEALHGLAAIAHAQRDLAGAKASYKRVLAINPMYLPALVGLADVEWESGERASASKTYKEIVDRFPPGTYPARIQQRLEGAAPAAPTQAPEQGGGG